MKTANKKVVSSIIIALFSLSILAGVIPVHAAPTVFDVYEGELIQPVINSADAGDKIVVHEGTYSDEQLIVNKTLTILGDGAVLEYSQEPTIPCYVGSIGPLYFAIQITADDVKLSGFEIYVTNDGYLSVFDASGSSGAVISNNIVEAPRWGIAGLEAANVKVKNNEVTATTPVFFTSTTNITVRNNILNAQVFYVGDTATGIRLPYVPSGGSTPSKVVVKNNKITSANIGIYVSGAVEATISNNEVEASNIGIQVSEGSDVVIKQNVVSSTRLPIWIADSPNFLIKENVVSTSGSTSENDINGISVTTSLPDGFSGGKIARNSVTSEYRGISVMGSSNTMAPHNIEIKENIVYKAVNGIEADYAPGVVISNNIVYATDIDPGIQCGMAIYLGEHYVGGVVKNNEVYAVDRGIQLHGSPDGPENIEIKGNTVYATKTGICMYSGSGVTMKNNVVYVTSDSMAVGMRTTGSNAVVVGNFVNSTGQGINVVDGDNAVIKNNKVNTTMAAMVIGSLSYESSNALVSGNVIHNCYAGIVPLYVSNSHIKNNVVASCDWFGIGLSGSNNVIKSNTVAGDFEFAIDLRIWELEDGTMIETTNNLITKNVIVGGSTPDDIGIELGPLTVDNTVSKNQISEVDFPIVDNGDNIIKS